MKSGDKNTSYFHRQFRARLSRNHISEITTFEGVICKGNDQIKVVVVSHFQTLYNKGNEGSKEDISEFLSNIPLMVNIDDNITLTKKIIEEDINNVIWSMEPDKAPGPDGFSIHFYRICWDIIKVNLVIMIKGFLQKANMGGNM